MPDDVLPKEPKHVMRQVARSMDRVRTVVARIGLRPYRVFFYREIYTGEEPGEGEISGLPDEAELLPPPRVRTLFLNRPEERGGASTDGALRLDRISRQYRREELMLRGIWSDDPPVGARFSYAVTTDGQVQAQIYKVAGEPILGPLGWSLSLLPANRRVRLRSA